jgi:iron complex outermembrane receptor protein
MGRVLYQEIEKPSFLTITLGDGTKPIQSTTLDQNWMYRFQKLYQGNYELHVIKNGETILKRSIRLDQPVTSLDLDLRSIPSARIEVQGSFYLPTYVALGKLQSLIKDFPQTTVVVPSSVIQETGSTRLDEALGNISGIVANSSSNYGFFDNQLIRGLGVVYTREGLNDGPTFMGYLRSLADVEQIEVLKGPGSSLLGSAGPGGTINLIVKKPKKDASTTAQLSLGSFNSQRMIIDSTGPLNQYWTYRVIGNHSRSDGFRDLSSSTNEWTASLLWQRTDVQSLLLTIENRHLTMIPDAAGIPFRVSSYRNAMGTYPFNHPKILEVNKYTSFVSPMAQSATDILRISANYIHFLTPILKWETNLAHTKRSLGFDRNFSIPDFNSPTGAPSLANRYLRSQQDRFADKSFQTFLTWKGNWGRYGHQIQLGLDIFTSDISTNRRQAKFASIPDAYHPVLPESGADLTAAWAWIFDRKIMVRQSGLYLIDHWNINNFLKLRSTFRQDHFRMIDDGSYNNLGNNSFTNVLNNSGQFYLPIAGLNSIDTALGKEHPLITDSTFNNGQIGLIFEPVSHSSFFIGSSWGRLANLSTEDPRTATLPESNRQVELGNRTQWLDQQINLTLSIYKTVRFNVPSISLLSGNPVITQTPEQRVEGLDLDLSARPSSNWFILLAWSWMNPVYTEPSLSDAWLKGKQLIGAPKRTGRIWSSYEVKEGFFRGWGLGLGFRHRDSINISFRSGPPNNLGIIPGYKIWDGGIFYRANTWGLQLNFKNLSDRTYWSYGIINAAVPGEGRNMSLDFRYLF